jgi:hypothetical protein
MSWLISRLANSASTPPPILAQSSEIRIECQLATRQIVVLETTMV